MSNATETTESLVNLAHQREADGKVKIVAVLTGGEVFAKSIWPQETDDRAAYLNELCTQYPGIATERKKLRKELERIARTTEIDLRFEPIGKINGIARLSARLFFGAECIESFPLDIFNPTKVKEAIRHFLPFVARRYFSGRGRTAAAETALRRLFMAELQKHAMPKPAPTTPQQSGHDYIPYIMDERGITLVTKTREGHDSQVPLANFSGKIIAEVIRDDGSGDDVRLYELNLRTRSCASVPLTMPVSEFDEMKWASERLGTRGHIWKGQGVKDAVRDAIVRMSGDVPEKRMHACPGWIKDGDAWVYLSGGAIISADDTPRSIGVDLDPGIASFVLPAPPTDPIARRASIEASLKILDLAKDDIVFPVYCLLGRAPLGWGDFVVNLVGGSGNFKSELAALAEQHFGAAMHSKNLPGSWESTVNAIGEFLFLVRDTLGVIDDLKLKGSSQDIARIHAKADTAFRWQGNGVGKGRMNASGGLRKPHNPRGVILSTAEIIPNGQSCRGRGAHVRVSPGDIPEDKLLLCQRDAEEGVYALAMAAYIRWLAQDNRIAEIRKSLRELIRKYRAKAQSSDLHKRTPEIVANLYIGLRYWLAFCVDVGAISPERERELKARAWTALGQMAEQQIELQEATDPVTRYLNLLTTSLTQGRAYIAGADGKMPGEDIALSCGWWQRYGNQWEPRSPNNCIGYVTHEGVFLIPEAAHNAATSAAGNNGNDFNEPELELRKKLDEQQKLAATEGGKFKRKTVRRTFAQMLQPVLWLKPGALPISCARSVRNEPQEGDGQ